MAKDRFLQTNRRQTGAKANYEDASSTRNCVIEGSRAMANTMQLAKCRKLLSCGLEIRDGFRRLIADRYIPWLERDGQTTLAPKTASVVHIVYNVMTEILKGNKEQKEPLGPTGWSPEKEDAFRKRVAERRVAFRPPWMSDAALLPKRPPARKPA